MKQQVKKQVNNILNLLYNIYDINIYKYILYILNIYIIYVLNIYIYIYLYIYIIYIIYIYIYILYILYIFIKYILYIDVYHKISSFYWTTPLAWCLAALRSKLGKLSGEVSIL